MKFKLYLLAFLGILSHSFSGDVENEPLEVFSNISYSALSTKQKFFPSRYYENTEVEASIKTNYHVVFPTRQGSQGTIRVVVAPKNVGVLEILT
jgi:hypothetical protein